MLPVVTGPRETRRQILIYAVLLVPLVLAPTLLGFAGMVYGIGAGVLGAVFVLGAAELALRPSDAGAKRLFAFSIFYLFLVFALLIVDRLWGAS
jgi:protoheme IX farnesyltransferase